MSNIFSFLFRKKSNIINKQPEGSNMLFSIIEKNVYSFKTQEKYWFSPKELINFLETYYEIDREKFFKQIGGKHARQFNKYEVSVALFNIYY